MIAIQISEKLEISVIKMAEKIKGFMAFRDWKQITEDDLWYELVSCILGSNVKFEHAQSFAFYLKALGFLDVKKIDHNFKLFESRITEALSRPISISSNNSNKKQKYRYPKLRSNHIRRTGELLYKEGNSIRDILEKSKDSVDARYKLSSNAIGIGPKQASLFLRNIGFADNLAILDTHILKYMSLLKLIPYEIKRITPLINYEKIEVKLQHYANRLSARLSYLDTAIWVVMRVYQKEFA